MHTLIFMLYACLVAFVSLRPVGGAGIEHWDKVLHLLVYFIFAVFGYRAFRGRVAYLYVCVGIVAYGGLLEVAQSYTPGRVMSVYDMLANTLGVLLGVLIVRCRRDRQTVR